MGIRYVSKYQVKIAQSNQEKVHQGEKTHRPTDRVPPPSPTALTLVRHTSDNVVKYH